MLKLLNCCGMFGSNKVQQNTNTPFRTHDSTMSLAKQRTRATKYFTSGSSFSHQSFHYMQSFDNPIRVKDNAENKSPTQTNERMDSFMTLKLGK